MHGEILKFEKCLTDSCVRLCILYTYLYIYILLQSAAQKYLSSNFDIEFLKFYTWNCESIFMYQLAVSVFIPEQNNGEHVKRGSNHFFFSISKRIIRHRYLFFDCHNFQIEDSETHRLALRSEWVLETATCQSCVARCMNKRLISTVLQPNNSEPSCPPLHSYSLLWIEKQHVQAVSFKELQERCRQSEIWLRYQIKLALILTPLRRDAVVKTSYFHNCKKKERKKERKSRKEETCIFLYIFARHSY